MKKTLRNQFAKQFEKYLFGLWFPKRCLTEKTLDQKISIFSDLFKDMDQKSPIFSDLFQDMKQKVNKWKTAIFSNIAERFTYSLSTSYEWRVTSYYPYELSLLHYNKRVTIYELLLILPGSTVYCKGEKLLLIARVNLYEVFFVMFRERHLRTNLAIYLDLRHSLSLFLYFIEENK